MTKRCLVFHCVWGFGKKCRVLFYLDFICCPFSLAARESCHLWLSLAAHLGYPERVQEAEDAWTLRPASRRGVPGSPRLNAVLLQSQHPPHAPVPMPFSALPQPLTGGLDGAVPPPCVPRCFHRGPPGSFWHVPTPYSHGPAPSNTSLLFVSPHVPRLGHGWGDLTGPLSTSVSDRILALQQLEWVLRTEEGHVAAGPAEGLQEGAVQVVVRRGSKAPLAWLRWAAKRSQCCPSPQGLPSSVFSLSK